MSEFISLFIIGVIAYVVIKLLFGRFIDNSGDIDLNEEQKLTDSYAKRN